jgi:hypothetical protein
MSIFDKNKPNDEFGKSMQGLMESVINTVLSKKLQPVQSSILSIVETNLPELKDFVESRLKDINVSLATKANNNQLQEIEKNLTQYIKLATLDAIVGELKSDIESKANSSSLDNIKSEVAKSIGDISTGIESKLNEIRSKIENIPSVDLEGYIKSSDLDEYKKTIEEKVKQNKTTITGGSGYAQLMSGGVKVKRRNTINFTGAGVTVTDNPATGSTDVAITGGGGGGSVDSVSSGTNISVDNTDPANPIVNTETDVEFNRIQATTSGGLSVYASDGTTLVADFGPANTANASFSGAVTVSGNVLVDTDTLYVDATNDRVGVDVTPTSKFHVRSDSIAATPTIATGLFLENSTAAAAGAQQWSPQVTLRSNGWKTNATAASQTVDGRIVVVPAQGSSAPTGSIYIGHSINGGAWTNDCIIDNTGNVIPRSGLYANGVIASLSSLGLANLWVSSAQGGTNTNNAAYLLGGAANTGLRTGLYGGAAYTVTASASYAAVIVAAAPATEASSGTHPVLANLAVKAPALTNGAGATTDTTTVYIEGAPTGSVTPTNQNYALLVASGGTKFGGAVGIGGNFSSTAWLAITSGTTTIASINFSSGTLKTTAARGDLEYNSTNWFLTAGDNVRRNIATWLDSSPTPVAAGAVPVATDYYGSTGDAILGTPDKWIETVVDGVSYASPLYIFG